VEKLKREVEANKKGFPGGKKKQLQCMVTRKDKMN
jgi:hypothetical protein